MAQRFAGIAFLNITDTEGGSFQLPLRGNFTVSPSLKERTMIAGQDYVHGFQELPRVPYIEGDISLRPDVDLETLERQVNVTVIAQLANGKQYTLIEATCKSAIEANSRDGQARVRWEGIWCEEIDVEVNF
jgi:Phage tail tube protein